MARATATRDSTAVLRALRDLLVILVLAGGLTAFVLGQPAVGAILFVVAGVLISLAARGHRYMSFGSQTP